MVNLRYCWLWIINKENSCRFTFLCIINERISSCSAAHMVHYSVALYLLSLNIVFLIFKTKNFKFPRKFSKNYFWDLGAILANKLFCFVIYFVKAGQPWLNMSFLPSLPDIHQINKLREFAITLPILSPLALALSPSVGLVIAWTIRIKQEKRTSKKLCSWPRHTRWNMLCARALSCQTHIWMYMTIDDNAFNNNNMANVL